MWNEEKHTNCNATFEWIFETLTLYLCTLCYTYTLDLDTHKKTLTHNKLDFVPNPIDCRFS
jgi:hypothetical protein